jgi:hypothetical protein
MPYILKITQVINSRSPPLSTAETHNSETAVYDSARAWLREEDARRETNRRAGTNQGPALTGLEIETPDGTVFTIAEVRRRARIIED